MTLDQVSPTVNPPLRAPLTAAVHRSPSPQCFPSVPFSPRASRRRRPRNGCGNQPLISGYRLACGSRGNRAALRTEEAQGPRERDARSQRRDQQLGRGWRGILPAIGSRLVGQQTVPAYGYRVRVAIDVADIDPPAAPASPARSAAVARDSSIAASSLASATVRPAHALASQPGHSPRSMKIRCAGCLVSPSARLPTVSTRPQAVRSSGWRGMATFLSERSRPLLGPGGKSSQVPAPRYARQRPGAGQRPAPWH